MKPGIPLVKKSLFRIICLQAILFLLALQFAQAQRIIGYFPNYNYSMANASGIQYAKMTHLYYFSLNPTRSVSGQTTGSLWFNDPYSWFTTASFNDVNIKAHAANPGIKMFIVTGGAPGSDSDLSTRLQYIGSTPSVLNTFCNNIINFIVTNNLDGWDLDWEFPDNAAARTAHQNLLAKMRSKIDSLKTVSCRYYEITAAVGGGYTDRLTHSCWNPAHTDYITQTAINYLDQINLMTYDGDIGAAPCSFSSHQHYDLVTKAFTDWRSDYTIPASKINIGVGFYDNSGNDFNSIGNVGTRYNNATYWNGGSGCANMQAKINYIHTQGGSGTMIWELTQDNLCAGTTPACYSLLDCMYQYTQSTWGTWVAPTVSCTAPVELISFVGSNGAQGNELAWATASEVNNDRFEIERSIDGITYTSIGSVNGAGNSSTLLNYFFTDATNTTSKTYYRLHQFDADGKSTYSKTVVVYSVQELTLVASPNPFKDQCSITVSGIKGEDTAQLIIYDLIGNVYANEILEVSNGSYEIGKNLPNGIYICALKTQDKTTHLRIVKTK
jgi:GH18 family chitinase